MERKIAVFPQPLCDFCQNKVEATPSWFPDARWMCKARMMDPRMCVEGILGRFKPLDDIKLEQLKELVTLSYYLYLPYEYPQLSSPIEGLKKSLDK